MNTRNNPEEVVRAFKSYITKVIRHTAIDYIRKIKKNNRYTFVVFDENIDKAVSFSNIDKDTAFSFDNNENILSDTKYSSVFEKLTRIQREILILTAEGKKDDEIAFIIGTTINSVRVIRNKARNKFKRK